MRERNLQADARRAHVFSKTPLQWQPPEILTPDGKRAVTESQALAAEAAKYAKLWRSSEQPPPRTFSGNEPLPRLTCDAIRRVAKSFKRRTGVAPDGWHPRHLALLPDCLLELFADIVTLIERSGRLPHQQAEVYVFLLDKAAGGTRPIGLFTATYRVWSKARQHIVAKWTAMNDRPFFC